VVGNKGMFVVVRRFEQEKGLIENKNRSPVLRNFLVAEGNLNIS
jgi:hypothetical protein